VISRRVVRSRSLEAESPAATRRHLARLLANGAALEIDGRARRSPGDLLRRYAPHCRLSLFDVEFALSAMRQNDDIRFFVAYVVMPPRRGERGPRIHPRIFYKDVSLIWRSASHFVRSANENWIGKGDVKILREGGCEQLVSDEVTTDLPLEIQSALEAACRGANRVPRDDVAVELVLRRGPDDRMRAYRDFTGPRARARADRRNLLNRGRLIARFARRSDPSSLRFAAGFEPDFERGVAEVSESTSSLYGGRLLRYRVVSRNRAAQYLFIASPSMVWIASAQATTTELMSYGLRTVDANVADDLLLPGFEYHFMDESCDPPELYSQIPPGFAGPQSTADPYRADASAWLERMPVIRAFRRQVLGSSRGAARDRSPRIARPNVAFDG
jgi:hypothetical protein